MGWPLLNGRSPYSGAVYNQDGVIPDITIHQSWVASSDDGDDEALLAAWEWLRQ